MQHPSRVEQHWERCTKSRSRRLLIGRTLFSASRSFLIDSGNSELRFAFRLCSLRSRNVSSLHFLPAASSLHGTSLSTLLGGSSREAINMLIISYIAKRLFDFIAERVRLSNFSNDSKSWLHKLEAEVLDVTIEKMVLIGTLKSGERRSGLYISRTRAFQKFWKVEWRVQCLKKRGNERSIFFPN